MEHDRIFMEHDLYLLNILMIFVIKEKSIIYTFIYQGCIKLLKSKDKFFK